MSIRYRFVLLLVGLVLTFGLAATGLRLAHQEEAKSMLASLRTERSDLLDRLLMLTGQSLQNFAGDYAQWDEMLAFSAKPDPAWAAINIEASLATFDAQAAWVTRADGTLAYSTVRNGLYPAPPLTDPAYLVRLRENKALHYYTSSAGTLLEINASPILPSDDVNRMREPRGWFIVAREWDDVHLRRLADTLQSQISLVPADTAPPPSASPATVYLTRALPGWDGPAVANLQVVYASPTLAQLVASNVDEAYLLYAFGFIVIVTMLVTVPSWVIRPLNQLAHSLESGTPEAIRELQGKSDEFGHLARQAAQSFLQRDALRESEDRLRQWMALHDRLGRDMHDGIIQSIYAAGLGLESARNQLHSDPAAAEQRLASCQRMFNDTLWQVRHFMEVLEPESRSGQSAAQSLTALVTTMQMLQTIPIITDLDAELAARIRPQQELHLLHMTRELLSNALRHSGARQVSVTLRAQSEDMARLQVADDGMGFDPQAGGTGGRGLANLAARARELDARLEIDTAPGKGTRIAVWFRPLV